MPDRQPDEVEGAGCVTFEGSRPQLDLVAEQRGNFVGMTGTTEESQRRCPPRGRAFGCIGAGFGRKLPAEHRGTQLRTGRLAERVILRDCEERRDLCLRDVLLHEDERRWGVHPMRGKARPVHHRVVNNTKTLTADPKIEAIQSLYAAFFRGDVDGFVADLADDVDWAAEAASKSVPWYGNYSGKTEVPGFFNAIGSHVDVGEFSLLSFTSNDTDVMVAIRWSYTVRATGKRAAMNMQHWWRFTDGKIVFFRGSEDTEQSAAAFA